MHIPRNAGLVVVLLAACSAPSAREHAAESNVAAIKVETQAAIVSPMPAAQLQAVQAALPKVAWPKLQAIFGSATTYWYDANSMLPSYQETGQPGGGANANSAWHNLIANTGSSDPNSNPEVGAALVYDEAADHWNFPFATTAGADNATNLYVVNFLNLPLDSNGNIVPIPISTASDSLHLWWQWQYPNGAVVGEILFIQDGSNLLPCEVRMRERYAAGWATNVFRPFTEAGELATAIQSQRPAWASSPQLSALVQQLQGGTGLSPLTLTATGLPGTFSQAGFLDPLPDFGDDQLVRDLLTQTTFVTAYDEVWRESADQSQVAYAPTTTATDLSIVPNNYQAGLLQVNEGSCVRCHQSTGDELGNWYPGLTLYGDVWGTDNVFSFHVFDQSYYPDLDLDQGNGIQDNRHMNPALVSMGMIKQFDPSTDTGPPYYNRTSAADAGAYEPGSGGP